MTHPTRITQIRHLRKQRVQRGDRTQPRPHRIRTGRRKQVMRNWHERPSGAGDASVGTHILSSEGRLLVPCYTPRFRSSANHNKIRRLCFHPPL